MLQKHLLLISKNDYYQLYPLMLGKYIVMNIMIIAGLTDDKLISKLEPIVNNSIIENIYLVRRKPLNYKKVISYHPSKIIGNIITGELYRIFVILYLCIFKKVDCIMGIYLVMHGIYAGIFGTLFSKPVIQNIIGNDLHHSLKYRFLFMFIKKAKVIVSRGENTKKILINNGIPKEKIFTPQNVFNFNNVPFPQKCKDKLYDIIYVGNLRGYKRLDTLLKVINKVKYDHDFSNISVAIVGGDDSKINKLKKLATQLKISGNISFLGWQTNVYKHMQVSKIFIMTSEGEGLPMAMVEAMSCGLPCIVPDDADISTLAINNVNSILVDVNDQKGYINAVSLLLNDDKLRDKLSKNAIKIKKEKTEEYSLDYNIKIWEKIFLKIKG